MALKSPKLKLNSERNTLHSLNKLTTLSRDHTLILTLISMETLSLPKMKPKSSTITTKTNNSLNIGSKPSSPMMSLERKSDKSMNPSWNIWPKSKPLKNLKTTLRLFSPSQKMNGSAILLLPNNSNLKETKSKEASVIQLTGRKVRISPSKTLKRNQRKEKKPSKRRFNLSSTSSKKSIWLKMKKKTTKKPNNKMMKKTKMKSQNSKDNMKLLMSFTKT